VIIFMFFLSAIFKPTTRNLGHSSDPARLFLDSGTKVEALLGSGNRGCAMLSVSYRMNQLHFPF
jgi:hypothetical protein